MTPFLHRSRRRLVWLCIAAALLTGAAAQWHILSHALQALQAPQPHEPAAAHSLACEQCLQFAAADGQAPIATVAFQDPRVGAPGACGAAATPLRGVGFTAYISRAPPRIG